MEGVEHYPHIQLIDFTEEGLDAVVIPAIMQEQEAGGAAGRDVRGHQQVVESICGLQFQEGRAAK